MNAKNFFTVVAITQFLFAVTLVFTPDFMGQQYLTDPTLVNSVGKLLAQFYGTLLLGITVACWYLRDSSPSLGRKAMFLAVLISNLALIVIHPLAILSGVETSVAWVQVVLAVFFSVWSFMLFRQEQSTGA